MSFEEYSLISNIGKSVKQVLMCLELHVGIQISFYNLYDFNTLIKFKEIPESLWMTFIHHAVHPIIFRGWKINLCFSIEHLCKLHLWNWRTCAGLFGLFRLIMVFFFPSVGFGVRQHMVKMEIDLEMHWGFKTGNGWKSWHIKSSDHRSLNPSMSLLINRNLVWCSVIEDCEKTHGGSL